MAKNKCPFCGRLELPKEKGNYIDSRGNYHNTENLTLAQIYDSGVQDGYKTAMEDMKKRLGIISPSKFFRGEEHQR